MQHYANKLLQWVRFYQQEGINITHLGAVNEPEKTTTYASMLMDGYQYYDFARVLRPAATAAFPHLKLTWNEAGGWEQARIRFKDLRRAAGSVAAARQWFDTPCAHPYDQLPGEPFDLGVASWQTEWAALSGSFAKPWFASLAEDEGITWANRLANAFVRSNVSMMAHWIGAETGRGASALVSVGRNSFSVSSRFYAWAAFCR